MTEYIVHSEASAPKLSQKILNNVKNAFGFIPNLMSVQSESPALLEGYVVLTGIFNKSNMSETERQIILMTNNRLNDCTYCMAAHTTVSKNAKVPSDIIKALREGSQIDDSKLEALRLYAVAVNEKRGQVDQSDMDALFAAGYTKETALEVILGTSLKVLSNYTDHIAQTPLDTAFKADLWSKMMGNQSH